MCRSRVQDRAPFPAAAVATQSDETRAPLDRQIPDGSCGDAANAGPGSARRLPDLERLRLREGYGRLADASPELRTRGGSRPLRSRLRDGRSGCFVVRGSSQPLDVPARPRCSIQARSGSESAAAAHRSGLARRSNAGAAGLRAARASTSADRRSRRATRSTPSVDEQPRSAAPRRDGFLLCDARAEPGSAAR
jgi:hypothetical protein